MSTPDRLAASERFSAAKISIILPGTFDDSAEQVSATIATIADEVGHHNPPTSSAAPPDLTGGPGRQRIAGLTDTEAHCSG